MPFDKTKRLVRTTPCFDDISIGFVRTVVGVYIVYLWSKFLVVSCSNTVSVSIVGRPCWFFFKCKFVSHHFSCFWNCRLCHFQIPYASVLVPKIIGSLPQVSGDESVPSVGGSLDVGVAVASVDVNASLPSASGNLSGECKSLGVECFFLALYCCASPVGYHGAFVMLLYESCVIPGICFTDAGLYSVLAPRYI